MLPLGSNVLEIGIGDGGSLRAFSEERPDFHFWALDHDNLHMDDLPNGTCFIHGEQGDISLLDAMNKLCRFSLIIDDGSHETYDHVVTFNWLFPCLIEGGFYVIEDLYLAHETVDFLNKTGEKVTYHEQNNFPCDVAVVRKEE